jgi:hypothetical protein
VSETEDLRAAEQRAEEIRAGVKLSQFEESLRKFGETGILRLSDDRLPREQVLDEAWEAITTERNAEYGEPIDNLSRWAGACNALGYRRPGGGELKPHDMAVIMVLGKACRTVESPDKPDTWVDGSGYFAIGYECVTLED